MGRPKEAKRVRLEIQVLPVTDRRLRKMIVKGQRDRCSLGKVIDKLAKEKA